MPRPKKPVSVEDAVGSPKKAAPKRRGTNFFGRKNQAVKKVKAETPTPTEAPVDANVRTRNGVVIPQYPIELRDPQLGERTPAVVQWYKENHPEAHAALYEGRKV